MINKFYKLLLISIITAFTVRFILVGWKQFEFYDFVAFSIIFGASIGAACEKENVEKTNKGNR